MLHSFQAEGRRFWAATAVLLAVLGAVQVASVRDDSATFDEGLYVTAGYSYLKTGDFRMNVEHPPLAKLLLALPLILLDPTLPLGDPSWAKADLLDFSRVFLYGNRVPADRMLFAARMVAILFTLMFGLAVALWAKWSFGAPAALVALFLFATDPNIIAHGRYATTDLLLAFFFFLAVAAWAGYLVRRRVRDLLWCGVTLGLALLTKFSAVLLLPVFAVLYVCRAWQEEGQDRAATASRGRLSVERSLVSMLVLAMICVAMVLAAYGLKARVCEPARAAGAQTANPYPCTLAETADPKTAAGHFLGVLARALHLPDHPYLMGFYMQYRRNQEGAHSYLLGQHSFRGWWYYFPLVFVLKTPTALLATVAFCSVVGLIGLRRLGLARLRELPFRWLALVMPVLIYFGSAMTSPINVGLRFLLPVYPFLFVFCAAGLVRMRAGRFRRAFPYVLALIVVVQAAECAAIYPHYLAFFNTLAGGPDRGARYVLDSNIDWGQDLKRLKRYLDANHVQSVCLQYFGTASPYYYGISAVPLPFTDDEEGRRSVDCVAAISVSLLNDLYLPPGSYAWLRQRQPDAKIGHSIYVFDLRKERR